MAKAKSIAAPTHDPIGAYLAVAIVYLAAAYLLDAVLRWLEPTSRIPGFKMDGRKA
jgi:ABC-type arginine/histidine transport system permease subunit